MRFLPLFALGFLAACSMTGGTPAASNQVVADSVIASNVALAFHEQAVEGWEGIDIRAKDGVVTLTGTLNSQKSIEKAVAVARKVNGVLRVDSHLELAAPPGNG